MKLSKLTTVCQVMYALGIPQDRGSIHLPYLPGNLDGYVVIYALLTLGQALQAPWSWASKCHCQKHKLKSLLGHLSHAATVVWQDSSGSCLLSCLMHIKGITSFISQQDPRQTYYGGGCSSTTGMASHSSPIQHPTPLPFGCGAFSAGLIGFSSIGLAVGVTQTWSLCLSC
jgi:hypothetical protein